MKQYSMYYIYSQSTILMKQQSVLSRTLEGVTVLVGTVVVQLGRPVAAWQGRVVMGRPEADTVAWAESTPEDSQTSTLPEEYI